MSQKATILHWLQREPITPAQALAHLGSFRLAARILEIKKDGYPVRAEMIETANGKHIARYSLVSA